MVVEKLRVSVVIPCFNEASTLRMIIERVLANKMDLEFEIIVIDDFSTDGSRIIIQQLHQEGMISKYLFQVKNMGKGAALREGFRLATGSIVIIQDGDLECDPSEYPKVLEPIISGLSEVVYGSRFLHQSPRIVQSFRRTLANKFLTNLSNIFTDLSLTDMETCYKAFKKEVIDRLSLKENRFGFEPEVTAQLSKLQVRIVEVAISYNPRTVAEGKKIGFRDGLRAIWVIIRN